MIHFSLLFFCFFLSLLTSLELHYPDSFSVSLCIVNGFEPW